MNRYKIKAALLSNKYSRAACRRVILTTRTFTFESLARRFILNKTARKFFFTSKIFQTFLNENSSITKNFITALEKKAWERKDRRALYRIGIIYKARREHSKSFKIFFYLLLNAKNEDSFMQTLTKAIQSEREVKEKKLMMLFRSGELSPPKKAEHFLNCEYTLHSDDFIPEWDEIISLLSKEFDFALANFFILAALGHQKIEHIDKLQNIIPKNREENSTNIRRTVTMIAAAYYRSGEKEKLQKLENEYNYDYFDWKIYTSFGRGEILEAMDYRGKTIRKTFLQFYPRKNIGRSISITPEKDLCGEAFNALFYPALYKKIGDFTVTCDERLYNILRRSFPYINFLPKTPRYKQIAEPAKFNAINIKLRDFLDNKTYKQTKKTKFIPIDYKSTYPHEDTQTGRKAGWFITDIELETYWKKKLGNGKKLIGISSNSTLRSRIRDMHMIGMEEWDEIFKLPNCKFINLNASLSQEDVDRYAKEYNIDFVNPEIDLFNDFDNLLAIMSILDFSIVPANNLMDFSSSLGINTIVFSPSNIMKTWATANESYIFSEKVKFIFPKDKENKIEKMILEGAKHIKQTLRLNETTENA